GGGDGTVDGSGHGGKAGGDGDIPTGSAPGEGSAGGGDSGGHGGGKNPEGEDGKQLARGVPFKPGAPEDQVPDPPGLQTVAAKDFSYDRTGLPHYPTAVTRVGSALTYPAEKTPDSPTGSGVKILTTSPFDTGVAW